MAAPALTSPTGRDRTRGGVTSSPRAGGWGGAVRAGREGRRGRAEGAQSGGDSAVTPAAIGWETPLKSSGPAQHLVNHIRVPRPVVSRALPSAVTPLHPWAARSDV